MKGKLLTSLFALPFLGVGVWMLWSVGNNVYDAWQMQDWVQVEATLVSGGYTTSSGDDADTYKAYAEYRYSYGGDRYTGNRVGLSGGGDNIGDYQVDIGRNLRAAAANGEPILVYVDPDNPADAIIDRGIRWGLLGFKFIFVPVFGGVGLFLLIAIWRAPKEKDALLPEYRDAPWLLNDAWQTATVRSGSKNAMWGAWAFAGFWNLISAPLPFLLYGEVLEKGNYIALIGLLFPLVGVGLLVWAIRRTREWTRFGAAPVTLDPFPGSIGGHVGGTIDLKLPYESASQFQLTLTNLNSYESGSGDDRKQRERAKWQDATVAHASPTNTGTRLTFRFDVPRGLDASDTDKDDNYYLWRLNLKAELAGTDLDRDYEIPVYATVEESRHLSDQAVQQGHARQATIDDESMRKLFELRYGTTGREMVFPMGRNIGGSLGGIIVGGVFAAAGWWLIYEEGARIFGSIFGGAGLLVATFGLYFMLNSLQVSKDHTGIVAVRRLLGIPISRKHMPLHEVVRLEKDSSFQSQSGSKHVVHYSIRAIDRHGNKLVVGEGFKGEGEANAAISLISREFGLSLHTGSDTDRADDGLLGPEALT